MKTHDATIFLFVCTLVLEILLLVVYPMVMRKRYRHLQPSETQHKSGLIRLTVGVEFGLLGIIAINASSLLVMLRRMPLLSNPLLILGGICAICAFISFIFMGKTTGE